jgi:hypothetical protein
MEQRSLRSHVLDLIGSFLYNERFPSCAYLQEGILNLIDSTSSYREEGEDLYPEVFITDNIDAVLETLPFCKKVEISAKPASIKEFSQALKLCAPLSKDGWVIYMNISEKELKYGLVSSEISELSPTFRKQAVGELSENGEDYAIAYLQNAGNKSVLLRGSETSALICLSLNDRVAAIGEELKIICAAITEDIDERNKDICFSYFEKLISNALITGHGNLIGVVKDEEGAIAKLKARHGDGIYLADPIDICELVTQSEEQKTREASTSNRLHSSLAQSMLNHDGLTVFSSKGRVLGYHIFVKPDGTEEQEIVGGARTRAYEILKLSKVFECCFYKSQDGNEKIWSAIDGN